LFVVAFAILIHSGINVSTSYTLGPKWWFIYKHSILFVNYHSHQFILKLLKSTKRF